jgi:double-stranded uracil-DNA glycosylase
MTVSGYTPDVLATGLDVVFCGINPAATADRDGHNFSHPSNRFWTVLHQAGFTDVRLRPEQERELLAYGCGITAVVTRATARASDVATAEFRSAQPEFEAKVQRYGPRVLAFLGKRALSAMVGSRIEFGAQTFDVAGASAWVLPNPSGLNRGFPTPALVAAFAELHTRLRT